MLFLVNLFFLKCISFYFFSSPPIKEMWNEELQLIKYETVLLEIDEFFQGIGIETRPTMLD